jgi:hypothetical protein
MKLTTIAIVTALLLSGASGYAQTRSPGLTCRVIGILRIEQKSKGKPFSPCRVDYTTLRRGNGRRKVLTSSSVSSERCHK